ncbi:bacillithiol system redox-active protein YtxJ [Gorillibacterium massiliense]|uniref:bacillithiol system redox-active protein YtxJ n=1 Tax=Gorillibacterium massiliense TaxID=1280390 RepID=UPI0004B99CD4|nr:bacillithiol system redox-active protein YtxJ [Gorillibacterium massiliense]
MMKWREIDTIEEWQSALEASTDKPVVILKHSTTCPVSANALKEYDDYLAGSPNAEPDYLLVKVIESRPVSNQIAADTGVTHQSPQIICIKNKHSYWNTSHWSITTEHISAVLD